MLNPESLANSAQKEKISKQRSSSSSESPLIVNTATTCPKCYQAEQAVKCLNLKVKKNEVGIAVLKTQH